ncbi:MAG: DciA family protein [Gallionella sp.]
MTQQLKTLLNGNQEFHSLVAHAQALSDLQRHFTAVAPPHLTQSIQILSLKMGRLSIAAANAASAAKLRQLAPELVVLLQNRGCEVSGIAVKVQVSYDRPKPKTTPRKLGHAAQAALQEFSLSLNDSRLKLALDRLVKKTKA